MPEPAYLISENAGVLEFFLNRPDKLNALNQEMFQGLAQALEMLVARADLRVLLIRAGGRFFCAGADLLAQPMPDMQGLTTNVRSWYRRELGGGMLPLYLELEAIEKPIVVAHHATCIGGGLELSLSCDFRLAAASACYGFPEAKLGMIPATGGISRLTRLVGPHWARWMIMANQQVDAAQAQAMGLVHAVYPDEDFDAKVMAFCQNLAKLPPEATAMAKLSIELAADLQSAQARNMERLAVSTLSLGVEHAQMMNAMRERLAGKTAPGE
jgi:enoyl-CoA hydratase/carnithine racemase